MRAGTGGRGWNVLWVLVLCTAALMAGPATRAAETTSGSLTASATSVIAGEHVQLRGTIAPRRSRPVTLQRLRGTRWVTVDASRTNSRGRFRFTTTPAATSRFRVVAKKVSLRSGVLKKVTTRTVTVTVLSQTASLSLPAEAARGAAVTADAVFTPARPGRPVALQQSAGGAWTTVATGAQTTAGAASLPVPTGEAGVATYRVVTEAWGGAAESVSASRTITVLGTGTPAPTDTTAPTVPSGLSAVAGDARVDLAWSEVADPDLDGYLVYRSTTSSGPWVRLTDGPLGGSTYGATGLTDGSTYWFSVSAIDLTGNESMRSEAASATPRAPFHVTTTGLPHATQATAYGSQLTSSGGTDPVTWSVVDGSLPGGLTLSAGGALSGIPTDVGTSTFTVEATDATSATARAQLDLTVDPPSGPVIADAALPAGQVGVGYAYAPLLLGGTGSYTWSVSSGALPPGLALTSTTGLVSGTPTSTGTAAFTLTAHGGNGSATRAVTLAVGPATSWGQPGADASRSGDVPGERTIDASHVSRLGVEWSPADGVQGRAVADGKVFSGGPIPGTGWDGLTVRDLASGEVLWSAPVRVGSGNSYPCAQVVVTAGVVLCQNGRIVAISRTGSHDVVWDTSVTDPGSYAPDVAVVGGLVVTGGSDGSTGAIAAYALATGELQWRRTFTGSVAAMALAADRVVAVVEDGSTDKLRTFALDSTGTPGWTTDIADGARTTVTVAGGTVVTGQGSDLVFRSVTDGSVLRTFTSTRPLWGPLIHDGSRVYAATARFDDFGGSDLTGVTAVGLGDGLEKWHVDTSFPLRAGMAVGGDVLWVHASDLLAVRAPSELLAVDTSTGTVLRNRQEPDTSSTAPVVGGGRVLVQTHDGLDVMGVMARRVGVPQGVLPTGWTDRAYAATLTGTGGVGALSWSVSGGALPPGLTLSAAGLVSGTPTATGSYDVTVRARDDVGMTATRVMTIAVRAAAVTSWITGAGRLDRNALAVGEDAITGDTTAAFALRWASAASTGPAWVNAGAWGEEPLVVGTTVFGIRNDGTLNAFDASTNGTGRTPSWTVTPPSPDIAFVGTPTLVGDASAGTLYVLGNTGVLHAIDTATHDEVWSYDYPQNFTGATHASPAVVGTTVVLAVDDGLIAVDTSTRLPAWTADVPGVSGTYGVSSDGVRVYAYAGCTVTARLVSTGAAAWTESISGGFGQCGGVTGFGSVVRSAPVVVDGTVYAAGAYDGAVALDAVTGAVSWRTNGQVLPPSVVTERWVVEEYAFDDAVAVLDRRTGEIVVRASLPFHPASSATVAGDLVLYQGGDARVHALDLRTLSQVWQSAQLGTDATHASVAVARGRVWTYTGDGRIAGIGAP